MGVRYTAEDYANLLHKIMPRGPIWPREDADSILKRIFVSMGVLAEALESRGRDLLDELHPTTTLELLREWEIDLGIPEECRELASSTAARRAEVLAKLNASEFANTPEWLVGVAASVGFTITVTEFTPSVFRAGSLAGDRGEGAWWTQLFQVNAALENLRKFRAGESRAGDSLVEFGNDQLECVISAVKPAHVGVIFAYS